MLQKKIQYITKLVAVGMIVLTILLGTASLNISQTSAHQATSPDNPFLTPTLVTTNTPAPTPTCMNLLDNMTVSHPTVEVGDIFTVDRELITNVLEVEISKVDQDENDPIIESVDPEKNQYRAVQPGTATIKTSVLSERYCSSWEWVYGGASVVITVVASTASVTPTETPTLTPVATDAPIDISTPAVTLTPTPIATPDSGCTQPFENMTIATLVIEAGDVFTMTENIITLFVENNFTLELQVDRIEQDEDLPIIEATDRQTYQYRALRTGAANIHVILSTEQYCWFWDENGIGFDYWTPTTRNVVVQVEVTGADAISRYVTYLPLIQD